MAAKDQTTRRLAATVASNSYRAHPHGRRRQTAGQVLAEVPEHLWNIYGAEIDPAGVLTPLERARRCRAAFRRDRALADLAIHRAHLGADSAGDEGTAS